MTYNQDELKSKIMAALDALALTLDRNKEKVNLMVQSFIAETPENFTLLHKIIEKENREELQAMLHKLKVRYSYFGLDEVMKEMDDWEREVTEVADRDKNSSRLTYFEKMNNRIVEELKKTAYYLESKTESVKAKLPLTGKKVLIAEDDEINVMVFELFIEELGGEVLKATDGNEAVYLATEASPDFIFMDVHMPHFNGVDAIKFIRSQSRTMPIIALSASTRLNEKQQSLEAGANEFLTKPAKRETIQQMLLKYIG